MLFLPTATAVLSVTFLFTLITALPQPRSSDVLDARQEDQSEYEDYLTQWLERQAKTLGKGNFKEKSKRNQMQFKHYEDTYGDLLAARLKRLGRAD